MGICLPNSGFFLFLLKKKKGKLGGFRGHLTVIGMFSYELFVGILTGRTIGNTEKKGKKKYKYQVKEVVEEMNAGVVSPIELTVANVILIYFFSEG